jgi:hypothetical protein
MTTELAITNTITQPKDHHVPKTKLPYLLQEALETGKWEFSTQDSNTETYTRGSEQVKIGTNALRSTNPPSYVYEYVDPENKYRKQSMTVINSLCVLLAKASKMSDPTDTVSTTTE